MFKKHLLLLEYKVQKNYIYLK